MELRLATFNLLNLARPGEATYPDQPQYSPAQYEAKLAWTAAQLHRMDADVVGFQEVFHQGALAAACARTPRLAGAQVFAPHADGLAGPQVALATRLPLLEPVTSIVDFPPGLHAAVESIALPVQTFSRAVLRARLQLPTGSGSTAPSVLTVFVAHLKSRRGITDPAVDGSHAPARVLGQARALIRRAAEAAALRMLILAEPSDAQHAVAVLGDLNDGPASVSTEIVTGRAQGTGRVLLSADEVVGARTGRAPAPTHRHQGRWECLDHILLDAALVGGETPGVQLLDVLRLAEHLDPDLHPAADSLPTGPERAHSDHAQLVARIRLP